MAVQRAQMQGCNVGCTPYLWPADHESESSGRSASVVGKRGLVGRRVIKKKGGWEGQQLLETYP